MSSPLSEISRPVITVVLDIDGLLSVKSYPKNPKTISFFQKTGAIIEAAGFPHYVPPGAIPFVRLLLKIEYVRVAFFSAAWEGRNKVFVARLLELAFPEDKGIGSKVKILSETDLTESTQEEKRAHALKYGFLMIDPVKNISRAVADGALLENAVLIDDEPSNAAPGQAANLLHLTTSIGDDYELLSEIKSDEKRVFHSVNRICYVAGLLFTAIETSQRKRIPLSQALFSLQFGKMEKDTYCPLFSNRQLEDKWYLRGCEELRKVQPDFELITPQVYARVLDNFPLEPLARQ